MSHPILTIPNMITLLRLGLVPVFVVIFYLPVEWNFIVSAVIFALAALTDWLDGYLARRLEQSSRFGAFLDPVADKLMVIAALILLVEIHASFWLAVPAVVIVGREVLVSALREWMAEIGKRASVAVSYVGKVKTTVQMFAVVILLANGVDTGFFKIMGYLSLYFAVGLTLWTMVQYIKAACPDLMESNPKELGDEGDNSGGA